MRLYDVLEHRGQTVLVMELVEGHGLDVLIADRTLDWKEARRICAPVAAALAHAHARGVVHRDLTPANILVEHASGRIVVTDFGLARLARSSRRAPISGVLAGTPEYWAPEQATGAETGPETDLYALGCILFRLLAGRVPFEGEDRLATGLRRAHEPAPSLDAAAPSAPAKAVQLVNRLLQRAPTMRGDAARAAVALGAGPASLPGAVRPRPRRRRIVRADARHACPPRSGDDRAARAFTSRGPARTNRRRRGSVRDRDRARGRRRLCDRERRPHGRRRT